jgi:hypothetical protein
MERSYAAACRSPPYRPAGWRNDKINDAGKRFLQPLVLVFSTLIGPVTGSGPLILSTIASFTEVIPYSTRSIIHNQESFIES